MWYNLVKIWTNITFWDIFCLLSFIHLKFRRKNRQNKAKSREVDASLSYMAFDSRNRLSDNHLYATCQTLEGVELNVTSKQNQETVSSQHTAFKTMHRIGPDYDVPLSDKPLDRDTSSICLYEVPYTNRMKRDSSPMPLSAVPNNSFIKRGTLPTLMNAAINVSIKSKPEKWMITNITVQKSLLHISRKMNKFSF